MCLTSCYSGRRRLSRASAVLALLLCVSAGESLAGSYTDIEVSIGESGGILTADFSLESAFTAEVLKKLQSGLTHEIMTQVGLYRADKGKKAIAHYERQSSVRYDIWEEKYSVRSGDKPVKISTTGELVRELGVFKAVPITTICSIDQNAQYYLKIRLAINFISKQASESIKWQMKNPNSRLVTPGRSFIGSFLRIFLDEDKPKYEDFRKFRSAVFTVPKVECK